MTTKIKRKNRFLSLLLVLVLMFSMIPVTSMTAYADANVTNGFYGGKLVVDYANCPGCSGLSKRVENVEINSISISNNALIIKLKYTCKHGTYTSAPNCYKGTSWSEETTLTIGNFSCKNNYNKRSCTNTNFGFHDTVTAYFTRSAGHSVLIGLQVTTNIRDTVISANRL